MYIDVILGFLPLFYYSLRFDFGRQKKTRNDYVCILLARHDDDIGNDKMAAVVVNVDDGQQNDHSTDQIQLIFNELGW